MIKISENVKKIVLVNIFIITICVIIMYIFVEKQNKKCINIVNTRIEQIVDNIKKQYPEIREEEIIQILMSSKNVKEDSSILKKYGLEKEEVYLKSMEQETNKFTNILVFITCAFGLTYTCIFVIYQKKKDKKILGINEYLKQINNRNYELKIEDNGEDELAKLRNELYKTTVLLKETAENSEIEKKNLSDSLADISHQLKTPLTSIRIMLDNIEDNQDMDEITRKDFLKEISSQIDYITSLVILLLKLAKLDANAIKLDRKEINVEMLIQDVLKNLAILIELKKIEVVTNLPKSPKFIGDYKWQREAITNIVKNAIEHSFENSKIYITAENSSVMLKLNIRDEGEGIEQEDRRHIFERFYKRSSEYSFGIGLSLAKSIIEKTNGYITVNSEIGKGTEFEIRYLK